jgi:hypothetical protein
MSSGATLADMIRARDRDALSGFFDGRAGYVIAYCSEVCPERARECAIAAFVEFLARVAVAGPDADLDLLLVKATRGCAAARIDVGQHPAVCQAAPELLAASANGELAHDDEALAGHLEGCATCQATAQQLLDAERALKEPPSADPPADVRDAWLRIALGEPAAA